MSAETGDDVAITPDALSDIRVQLTRIGGNVENLRTLIDTGDRHTQQLIELQKNEVRHLADMQAQDRQRHYDEMMAIRLDLKAAIERADMGLSVVRADSKTYIDEHAGNLQRDLQNLAAKVDALRMGWAKATGIATVAALFSSAAVAAIVKGLT